MEALFTWVHETLGMCFYTLPALLTGLAMVIIGLVHWRNQKKREDDFKDETKNAENGEGAPAPEAAE